MTGYLKLSISVLGPKDKPKIHDPEEDERKEREAGADQTLCLMPPSIKRFTQFLVRHRCQPREARFMAVLPLYLRIMSADEALHVALRR